MMTARPSDDSEAVVLGPDGLSRFDELRRREAAHSAMLFAFDLIEHDDQDLRDLPFLDRKSALARLLRGIEAGILVNEHVAEDGCVRRAGEGNDRQHELKPLVAIQGVRRPPSKG